MLLPVMQMTRQECYHHIHMSQKSGSNDITLLLLTPLNMASYQVSELSVASNVYYYYCNKYILECVMKKYLQGQFFHQLNKSRKVVFSAEVNDTN
jgi:hypothetical protein